MATTRLVFLYPQLMRSARWSEPTIATTRRCCDASSRRTIVTTPPRDQQFGRRHGKAVQPMPLASDKQLLKRVSSPKTAKTVNGNGNGSRSLKGSSNAIPTQKPEATPTESTDSQQEKTVTKEEADKEASSENKEPLKVEEKEKENPALDTILYMDPPKSEEDDAKGSHLHPPPYVHHFDSYTLVRQVQEGGFSEQQAITAMKAVRGLLSANLELAKEELVSKSDVENESYLFKAACSELRTEIQNTRRANDERMRQDRTILQHEADILNQKLSQELSTMKDDLKGMFNDRRMAVREEQSNMEKALQELNYKITIALNSDSKSEVEGLRWVLTRRAVIALVFSALMILSFLRYVTYKTHQWEEERKKQQHKRKQSHIEAEILKQQEQERIGRDGLAATGAVEILSAS